MTKFKGGQLQDEEHFREDLVREGAACRKHQAARGDRCLIDGRRAVTVSCTGRYNRAVRKGLVPALPGGSGG